MTGARAALVRSVQARLARHARAAGRLYEDVLVRHALERFLFRLGEGPWSRSFILKGGLLVQALGGERARSTRDIDLLGTTTLTLEGLQEVVGVSAGLEVPDDGWQFDAGACRVSPLRAGTKYPGLRANLPATLGRSRVRVRIDVGSGDALVPPATELSYPTLLDQAPPRLYAYSPSTIVAEKLEAMIALGTINSRVKDYFDIALLARTQSFNGQTLVEAIRACCARRGTQLPTALPAGLSRDFEEAPAARDLWRAFSTKLRQSPAPMTWRATVGACREFVEEPLGHAEAHAPFAKQWPRGGPWC